MVWLAIAIFVAPLLLCVLALLPHARRNRALRARPGKVPVRLLRPGTMRWARGHGVWIHDVFAFRGSPAAWKEELIWVAEIERREPIPEERAGWPRLGDDPVVAVLIPVDAADPPIEVAVRREHEDLMSGPFMTVGAGLQ